VGKPIDTTKYSHAIWMSLSALFVASLAIVLLVFGPSHIMAPWDVFSLLGGAWRILNHQIPHKDFHNPIGAITYSLIAAGMKISGPSLKGYIYGNVIFLVISSSWAAVVFFRRLGAGHSFLLTVFIATLVAAQRPLGYDPSVTTYAMIYNRYGWALLSILYVQLFVPVRENTAYLDNLDATMAGLLLGIIFFVKISFFIVGCAALALALVVRPQFLRKLVFMGVGFALVVLGMWVVLGISSVDYVLDISTAGHAQSVESRWWMLKRSVNANILQISIAALIWLLLVGLPAIRSSKSELAPLISATVVYGFTVASAILISAGNAYEAGDLPLLVIAGIILLNGSMQTRPVSHSVSGDNWKYVLCFVLIFFVFLGRIAWKDAYSLVNMIAWNEYRIAQGPAPQHFEAEPLRDFVIPATSEWRTAYSRAKQVPARVNDGLALIRRHVPRQRKILVLAFTDPFSFALGLVPPRNVPLWWDPGFSFNEAVHPTPTTLFSDADFVVIPILRESDDGCCLEIQSALSKLYGDYLSEHFSEIGRSEFWSLLVKSPG
jgi:hypothetical protein